MTRTHSSARGLAVCLAVLVVAACGSGAPGGSSEANELREIERERLRALVDADVEAADRLHSEDFQLVTPTGLALTRTEYLNGIRAGEPDYVGWEAGDISVKLAGNLAVLRYRDVRFDVDAGGQPVHRGPMYHTNVYERREGQWQAVWSQASGVVARGQANDSTRSE